MKIKRILFLTHRWFGIAMCLMFFLWFASGIIMMYVEYPELTEAERMESLPSLDINAVDIDVDALEQLLPTDKTIESISISTHLNRPIFQAQFADYSISSIYADTGDLVQQTNQESAEQVANIFAQNSGLGGEASYLKTLDMDQWTVYGGFDAHRPLHKVALNNPAGTIVYLSDSTGQVLRDTHRWERGWNWLGSTIHWIYPMQLRKYPDAWVNVVIVVSILGIIAVVTGTVVGVMRLRVKKRYKSGSVTPYSGMQKWHHLLGVACTFFVTMFIVSGLFSMNPFGIFNDKSSPYPQVARYYGEEYSLSGLQSALDNLQPSSLIASDVKELSWQRVNSTGTLIAHADAGRHVVNLTPDQLETTIRNAVPLMLPNDSLVEFEKLEQFDNHYYSTHNRYRPLPAYRAKFDDEEKTWYYIDAETGELLSRSTSINRVQRWLYNGLHSLDFQILLANRPVWDLVVIVLSVLGVAFSITSVVIGWRRLGKTKLFKRGRSSRAESRTAA